MTVKELMAILQGYAPDDSVQVLVSTLLPETPHTCEQVVLHSHEVRSLMQIQGKPAILLHNDKETLIRIPAKNLSPQKYDMLRV